MKKKTNIESWPDIEIVDHYRKTNDNDLVGILFKRYTRFVFLVCMKYLKDEEKSKDASMQIFENLFTDLLKYDIKNFKAWLHSVTKNYCLLQFRSDKHSRVFEEDLKKVAHDDVESEGFLYLHNENAKEDKLRKLEDALGSLSKEQKICIELFYLKEKCYDEVSEITGYNFKQVKSYIQNGKRNLKNILQSNNE